jgi:hypothetical protein
MQPSEFPPNVDSILAEIKSQHIRKLEDAKTPGERLENLTFILEEIVGMPMSAALSIPDYRYISFKLQKDGIDLGVCEHYSIRKRFPARVPGCNDYDEFCSFNGEACETTCNGGFAKDYCVFLNGKTEGKT